MSEMLTRVRNRRRKEARPAEIIESALKLWKEKGFAATKMEDVAKKAGVAKGTVYLYFKSKEALFEAAVGERLSTALQDAASASELTNASTRALLKGFYTRLYAEFFERGSATLMKVLISEGQRFPSLVESYRSTAVEKGMVVIRGILARGVSMGELRVDAEEIDPRLIMSPVILHMVWGMVFGDQPKDAFQGLIDQHLDLILGGLVKK